MLDCLPGDVTRILRRLEGGDRDAVADLLPLVYQELHRLADAHMDGERGDHTLQPTALLHEAYLRMVDRSRVQWNDRRHFMRAAAVVMRSILVNHARDRKRLKRGGGAVKMPLDETMTVFEERAIDLIALDEALEKLETIDPRKTGIIELRFFGGLSVRETADTLGISERTVEADWHMARSWLRREITRE